MIQRVLLQNISSKSFQVIRRQFSKNNDACKIMFTKTHEYIKFKQNNVAIIGISSYASKNIGEIIFADLTPEDEAIEKNQTIGILESVKSANEIYSPVNGIILEHNVNAIEMPNLINDDSLGEGWLLKISCVDKSDPELMDSKTYDKYVESIVMNKLKYIR